MTLYKIEFEPYDWNKTRLFQAELTILCAKYGTDWNSFEED